MQDKARKVAGLNRPQTCENAEHFLKTLKSLKTHVTTFDKQPSHGEISWEWPFPLGGPVGGNVLASNPCGNAHANKESSFSFS